MYEITLLTALAGAFIVLIISPARTFWSSPSCRSASPGNKASAPDWVLLRAASSGHCSQPPGWA